MHFSYIRHWHLNLILFWCVLIFSDSSFYTGGTKTRITNREKSWFRSHGWVVSCKLYSSFVLHGWVVFYLHMSRVVCTATSMSVLFVLLCIILLENCMALASPIRIEPMNLSMPCNWTGSGNCLPCWTPGTLLSLTFDIVPTRLVCLVMT